MKLTGFLAEKMPVKAHAEQRKMVDAWGSQCRATHRDVHPPPLIVGRKKPSPNCSCMLLKQLLVGLQSSTFPHPILMYSSWHSSGIPSHATTSWLVLVQNDVSFLSDSFTKLWCQTKLLLWEDYMPLEEMITHWLCWHKQISFLENILWRKGWQQDYISTEKPRIHAKAK